MSSTRTTSYSSRYEEQYQWCTADPKDPGSARCKWCNRSFKINSMGKVAFSSHEKGKGHQREFQVRQTNLKIKDFSAIKSSTSKSSPNKCVEPSVEPNAESSQKIGNVFISSKPESAGSSSTLNKYVVKEQIIAAEIIWALETIYTHSSYRSSGSDVVIFKKMFPDSEIAARMELGRTKMSYLITYGIAPYFTTELLNMLDDCNEFVFGFDETLNKIVQRQQMDVGVRFCNVHTNQVEARYIGSAFLSSTRSNDLVNGMKECFSNNPVLLKKVIQCSMDGPAVNWKAFRELTAEIKQLRSSPTFEVLNIGSCGLHTVHNAFRDGFRQTKWHVEDFLMALYSLFKNVPLRRSDYTATTGSNLFPLKFCDVRWVENESVAARALQMLPHLKIFVQEVRKQEEKKLKEGHPNFKRSFASVFRSKVFTTVAEAVDDKMLKPKLNFFVTSASLVEKFLKEYQTESPMAPFLFDDLTMLVKAVMEKIVKPEQLKVKDKLLFKIELSEGNLLPAINVDIGFSTKVAIKSAKDADKVTEQKILLFRNDCRAFYTAFLKKILIRSPLAYPLTRYLTCINPEVIINFPDTAMKRLDLCLELLVDKEHLTGTCADKIKEEYRQLLAMPSCKIFLSEYRRNDQRLDTFWMHLIDQSKKAFSNLCMFVRKILILSHGNATLERGFSINQKCLIVNQTERSLTAQRIVYDAITNKGKVSDLTISKTLLQYARNARSKYESALKTQKNEEDAKEKEKQRKREIDREVKELTAKKAKLMTDAQRNVEVIEDRIKKLKT